MACRYHSSKLLSVEKTARCAASNVGPYGLFWQPALVRYSSILYLCLVIGQIKMLACLCSRFGRQTNGQTEGHRHCVKPSCGGGSTSASRLYRHDRRDGNAAVWRTFIQGRTVSHNPSSVECSSVCGAYTWMRVEPQLHVTGFFSLSGLVMKPNRARMSVRLLKRLAFLKRNDCCLKLYSTLLTFTLA